MLAQSFKSAADLKITEVQHDALRKVLVLLETGKLKYFAFKDDDFVDGGKENRAFSGDFNMGTFGLNHKCGTAACIAGTAELISSAKFVGVDRPEALSDLFYAESLSHDGPDDPLDTISPTQAATALRSYLTTGDANWPAAVFPSSRDNSEARQDG